MKARKTKAKAKAAEGRTEATPPRAAEYARERREIAVGLLEPAPWNPRGRITPESVADLVDSIRTLGVIQPLVAMQAEGGRAVLVAGHRRLVAAKAAGLESVPCDVLVGLDEATARRMTFIENLQRTDADPLLESELVGSLVKSGMTQDEIAAEAGRGREWVARRLNLSRLSKSWRRRVKDGERITTDCLEHVAAYPEAVQEKLKAAKPWNAVGALRWCDIEREFARETADLKAAAFDRAACRSCPNNTGCSPDLFDWSGRPTAFGKCLDPKCYKGKCAAAIEATVDDAKARGVEVRETKQHPDYSIDLQSKPDARHDTLYVWKDYNGETVAQWGEAPSVGKPGGGLTEEQREERRRKIAANKARRKLAEWCASGAFADAMRAKHSAFSVPLAKAYQDAFGIGSSQQLFGSRTNGADAAARYLVVDEADLAPRCWADEAAAAVSRSLAKEGYGPKNAELVLALFAEARAALTDEERQLLVSDENMARIQNPDEIRWIDTEAEPETAEDAAEDEADAPGEGGMDEGGEE